MDPVVIQGILHHTLPADLPQIKTPFLNAEWEALISSKSELKKLKSLDKVLTSVHWKLFYGPLTNVWATLDHKEAGVMEVPVDD